MFSITNLLITLSKTNLKKICNQITKFRMQLYSAIEELQLLTERTQYFFYFSFILKQRNQTYTTNDLGKTGR